MKLISITDFILSKAYKSKVIVSMHPESPFSQIEKIEKYANFVKQPLTIGMFVPCDKKGNQMKQPFTVGAKAKHHQRDYLDKYKEAEERVLFKDFKIGYNEQEKICQCILPLVLANVEGGFAATVMKQEEGEDWMPIEDYATIEDMTNGLNFPFTLTPTAIKELGL